MMKVGMNMFVKTLALPFLVAPIFVSCMVDDPEDKFDFSSDGQPIANYQIMGKVSDEDGKPINGIRVIADYSTDVIYRADTLYTDQEGEYSKFMSIPRVDKFYMSFTDIDGQANGGEFGPNPNMSLRFAPRSQAAISAAPMSSRSTPRSKRNDVKDGGLSCFLSTLFLSSHHDQEQVGHRGAVSSGSGAEKGLAFEIGVGSVHCRRPSSHLSVPLY